jgi:hypothetical protein
MLPHDRAVTLLETHFKQRKVDETHWSAVYQSFLCGRDSGVSHAELRERMTPVAANDNSKDDTIDAETLLGMDFEPLEYVIPGFASYLGSNQHYPLASSRRPPDDQVAGPTPGARVRVGSRGHHRSSQTGRNLN